MRPGSALRPGPDRAEAGVPVHELRARVADRLPPAVRAARWSLPGSAAAVALLLCALVAGVALLVGRVTAPGPQVVPARAAAPTVSVASGPAAASTGTAPAPSRSAAPGTSPGTASGVMVVHVVGQVGEPGVVELPVGARVADAVRAAGGAAPDADLGRVNLARPLVDGEQVVVPRPGEELPAATSAGLGPSAPPAGTGAGPVTPLDLNAATVADLDALPGIGPVLAQRILDWRTEHGRFTSVDELAEVKGIGDSVLEQVRPLVRT